MDSYFIHRYIIKKYGQVRFRVKSANYYESYGPFFNFIFCKMPACVFVGEDGPGRGHLCHTDTFLVFLLFFFFFVVVVCHYFSSLLLLVPQEGRAS